MATPPTRNIDKELVRELAKLLEETGLMEIEYGCDDWHIRVSGATQQISSNISDSYTKPAKLSDDATITQKENNDIDLSDTVSSPMVGIVFTSSDPQTPPFVKIGDQIAEGQTLLLIEAMKVFNPITAPKAGKVKEILITNGAPVEFGEPLLTIE